MAHTSWRIIAADVVRSIEDGELGVGSRVPSGEDLAVKWGVSRHTAHRAIEELQRQGIVVRQRRWGTVVAGRRSVKTGRVGFLADQFARAYDFPAGDLIRGIQDALGEEIHLVVAESKGDSDTEVRQLRKFAEQVDGLILYPTSHPHSKSAMQRLVEGG